MKHNDALPAARQIDHPEGARYLPDPAFPHAASNCRYRFPVRRVVALLHLTELVTGLRTSIGRKVPQAGEAIAKERNWFQGDHCIKTDTEKQAIVKKGILQLELPQISLVAHRSNWDYIQTHLEQELVMEAALQREIVGLLGIGRGKRKAMAPLDVMVLVERGLPVAALERLSKSMAPAESGFKYRVVKKTTLDRRQKATKRLTRQESDQLVRLAKIWALAKDVWGNEEAARDFLFRPHLMLTNRRPVDVALGTEVGAQVVDGILGRLKYGSAA